MLPPILPRPTMPIFIEATSRSARRRSRHAPAARPGARARPAAAFAQGQQVAGGLGPLERGEAVGRAGDRHVVVGVVGRRTCTNTPVGGPPLWSWPVECRKRGPRPTVVATRSRSRSATRARSRPATAGDAGVDEGLDGQVVARRRPGRAASSSGIVVDVGQARRSSTSAGGRLGRGHVGLVERVGCRAARRTGRWPAPTAAPAPPRSAKSPSNGSSTTGWPASARASSAAVRAVARRPRTAGRRRRPRARPSGSPTTGTTPVPSLPVDSASSCSSQRPNVAMLVGQRRSSACRGPARTPAAMAAAEPGRRVGGGRRRAAGRPSRGRGVEQLGDVDARQQRRARCRSTTAPSSGRRCRAGSRRRRRTRGRPPARPGRCRGR